ncbi:hypothetical protein RRSWK_03213 [Rhodopirellula sp. SWK7]|nr:hypothetical protein RRSWK_03213 [Rhodopirellula sp. SWK7]
MRVRRNRGRCIFNAFRAGVFSKNALRILRDFERLNFDSVGYCEPARHI